MKKLLTVAATLVALLITHSAWARAGGGVSVGRAAPSIARSVPAPRYTPPPAPRPVAAPTPAGNTTVINQGGGFASSFLGGAAGSLVGNALSHPSPPVVAAPVMAGTAVAPGMALAGATPSMLVVEQRFPWGWFWFAILLLAIAAAAFWWYHLQQALEDHLNDEEFDELHFFYSVQQASMDDDKFALSRLCTPGMTAALSGNPEPGRNAIKTLTGVTYAWYVGDSVEFSFFDTKESVRVRERWQLRNNRLEGIEVLGPAQGE